MKLLGQHTGQLFPHFELKKLTYCTTNICQELSHRRACTVCAPFLRRAEQVREYRFPGLSRLSSISRVAVIRHVPGSFEHHELFRAFLRVIAFNADTFKKKQCSFSPAHGPFRMAFSSSKERGVSSTHVKLFSQHSIR